MKLFVCAILFAGASAFAFSALAQDTGPSWWKLPRLTFGWEDASSVRVIGQSASVVVTGKPGLSKPQGLRVFVNCKTKIYSIQTVDWHGHWVGLGAPEPLTAPKDSWAQPLISHLCELETFPRFEASPGTGGFIKAGETEMPYRTFVREELAQAENTFAEQLEQPSKDRYFEVKGHVIARTSFMGSNPVVLYCGYAILVPRNSKPETGRFFAFDGGAESDAGFDTKSTVYKGFSRDWNKYCSEGGESVYFHT